MREYKFGIAISLILILVFSTTLAQEEQADAENCNLCHSLALLGIAGENGSIRSFEVAADSYNHSIHRNVVCRDCHTDINEFPHPQEIKRVDCSKACHISRPFALTGFSHEEQVAAHARSSHAMRPEYSEEQNAQKPDCKYCHSNAFRKDIEQSEMSADISHCIRCHENRGLESVILHLQAHTGHRAAETSIEVVNLCSSCHADQSRMREFDVNLTQVAGFEHQFHGKALKRGLDEVANCMDCHRNHLNLPADDPNSSIHANNIQMTCSANSFCHPDATPEFALAAIHSKPTPRENAILFYVEWGFILLTAGVMSLLFAHIFLDFGRWIGDSLSARRKRS